MPAFEILTWALAGVLIGMLETHLRHYAPSFARQLRAAVVGAGAGVFGGFVGRMLSGEGGALGGHSLVALLVAVGFAILVLALGRSHGPGHGTPRARRARG